MHCSCKDVWATIALCRNTVECIKHLVANDDQVITNIEGLQPGSSLLFFKINGSLHKLQLRSCSFLSNMLHVTAFAKT